MKKFINKIMFEKTNSSLIQFIRYFFVGGIAAVVNIGSLFVFVDLCDINYLIANVFSFILGLLVNFLLSKKFVFTNENSMNKAMEFGIHTIIAVIGLVIDTSILHLFTSKKVYYMLSKLISTAITFIWNFLARKILYIFIDKR